MRKDYILYLGNYIDSSIKAERRLPTNNPAGSNRMNRLALALATHFKPIILSPGISLNIAFSWNLFKSSQLKHKGPIVVLFTSTLTIPLLGLLFSQFSYIISVIGVIKRTKVRVVLIYNFDVLSLIISYILRWFYKDIKIINNIEDVSVSKLRDFKISTEERPFQQLIFAYCMNAIARLSHAYIIPTRRFLNYLPENKPFLVITGCLKVPEFDLLIEKETIDILFAGKISAEHGIDVFISAMHRIEASDDKYKQIRVVITGGGAKSNWLKDEVSKFENLDINYYGFVTKEEYEYYLKRADICVALQNDKGRYANFKTPSKVYEYLGHSKIVIASDVGDLSDLPKDILTICKPFTGDQLFSLLNRFINDYKSWEGRKKLVHKYSSEHFDLKVVGDTLIKFIYNQ